MTRCHYFTWGLLPDFDKEAIEEKILRWLLRNGRAILAALPTGTEQDAANTQFTKWKNDFEWHVS